MSIRLSKACKDLNVGMSTAIEFLAKKGYKHTVDLNTKLSDDEYLMLAKEFNKDMALKMESERLSNERHLKEKAATVALDGYTQPKQEAKPEVIKTDIPNDIKPQIKAVGQIDLDALNKPHHKPVAKVPEQVVVKEEVKAPAPEVVVEKPEPKVQAVVVEKPIEKVETKIVEVPEKLVQKVEPVEVVVPKEEPKKIAEPVQEKPVVEKQEVKAPEKAAKPTVKVEVEEKIDVEPAEDAIFTLSRPAIEKGPVVIGNIDLNLLNQSTRPKPKTKEQKRKEREEKGKVDPNKKPMQITPKPTGDAAIEAKKKKRERFSNQKVDINKVQQGGSAGGGGGSQPSMIKKPVPQGAPGSTSNAAKPNKDSKFKKPLKTVVNEEEVQKQIKETLARLASGNKKGKGAKYRRDKRDTDRAKQQEQAQRQRDDDSIIKLTEFVTVSELATMMDVSVNQVIATCMAIGMMVSINQRLDAETIKIVADEFGFSTEFVSAEVVDAIGDEEVDTEEDLEPRAPIVTVMGHVDHGKTSLLDYIRKTNVIAGEAGGITQHIGAYNVKLENGQKITFLDTPGHEAFTAMRARGAKVTDIAIIIVAADDNVMPQTIEAINHAAAANVPMIFAINKVDKPGANPEKIKETLAGMNYLVEDWGGKYQSQDISAKHGKGIEELLEKVLLEAELLELKANPNRRAMGSVIESELDKGRGYISTVLIENGTLNQGDVVLAGTHFGKIKAMFNERNQRIKTALPAEPVLILGLNGAPQAGDNFNVMATEQEAREIANKREQLQREQSYRTKKHFTLDELGRRIALGDFKELNIIVKGDVDGSVEALSDSLLKLSTENIQVNVIHKAVGAISDSDILLAAASNAIICGFQVRPTTSARKIAEKEEIDIRLYSIIYDAIEEIKAAMEGMLSPEIKEEITATIEILEVFKITKVGTIAGCLVREGKVKRNNKVRIIRDGIVVYTGELDSLKRFKEDVKEVGTNYECGLNIKGYNDIQVGDMVESFEETEVKKTL
jgi:translation initiation factor IF-2